MKRGSKEKVKRGPKEKVIFDAILLRDARRSCDFTQEDLAAQAHISIDTVRRAERGMAISFKASRDIASALGKPVSELEVKSKNIDLSKPVFITPQNDFFSRVFGGNYEHPSLIPEGIWKCYKELFPNESTRNSPEDIVTWLTMERERNLSWLGLFFTLQTKDTFVGFCYVEIHRSLRWITPSYFGILKDWRAHGLARGFLNLVLNISEATIPDLKGLIFEVEIFNEDHLQSAEKKLEELDNDNKMSTLTESEKSSVRSALRIAVYTGRALGGWDISKDNYRKLPGALAVALKQQDKFEFLEFLQPALQEPLHKNNESVFYLMIYPLPSLEKSIGSVSQFTDKELPNQFTNELVSLFYDELFPSAYSEDYPDGSASSTAIPGYGAYLKDVKVRYKNYIAEHRIFLTSRDLLPKVGRRIVLFHGTRLEKLEIFL